MAVLPRGELTTSASFPPAPGEPGLDTTTVAMAVATGEVETTWLLLLRERLPLPTRERRDGEAGPPEVVMDEAGTATGGREATRVEPEVVRFSAGSVNTRGARGGGWG